MNWIDNNINQYYDWLKNKTYAKTDSTTNWTVITTPFFSLFNDPIEIYVKQDGNKIVLSDDSHTIQNLDLAGASISRSPKRKEWIDHILLNYGVVLKDGQELTIEASQDNFAQCKHNLICTISEIGDMEIMSKRMVTSLFKEYVKSLLDEQNIIYTPQFIAKGSTGIEFTFDFQIASKTKEVVIKSFNSLNKMNVPNFLFSLDDIKSSRERISGKELQSLAIINDIDKDIKSEYVMALESKHADCIMWSERNKEENLQKLRLAS